MATRTECGAIGLAGTAISMYPCPEPGAVSMFLTKKSGSHGMTLARSALVNCPIFLSLTGALCSESARPWASSPTPMMISPPRAFARPVTSLASSS